MFNLSYSTNTSENIFRLFTKVFNETNFTMVDIIVWNKTNRMPLNISPVACNRICEPIFILCRKNEKHTFTTNKKVLYFDKTRNCNIYDTSNFDNIIYANNNDGYNDLNSATFSTSLVNQLIERYVLPNDIVLDNFSGTATTAYACEQHNIKNIAIELSKQQCEYSKKRLLAIQLSLF